MMADAGDGSQAGHEVETSRSADVAPKDLQPAHTSLPSGDIRTVSAPYKRRSATPRLVAAHELLGGSTAGRSMSKLAVRLAALPRAAELGLIERRAGVRRGPALGGHAFLPRPDEGWQKVAHVIVHEKACTSK
jgi:hypothetical protein